MTEVSIKIVHENGSTAAFNSQQEEVRLVYQKEYEEGDKVILSCSTVPAYLMVQVDDALGESFVYITKKEVSYTIPFGEKKICYSKKTFFGDCHLLSARLAEPEEVMSYKNLALNKMDQHGDTGCYPHAFANVETRGESVFAAKNAINGNRENHSHGIWPYESWGINMQDDAAMTVEFGRMVRTDKIVLFTRSDFPHDNWWKQVTLCFSDGTEIVWELEKSDKAHILTFEEKKIEWVRIEKLIKADDPSPFPALSQIEVFGREA